MLPFLINLVQSDLFRRAFLGILISAALLLNLYLFGIWFWDIVSRHVNHLCR